MAISAVPQPQGSEGSGLKLSMKHCNKRFNRCYPHSDLTAVQGHSLDHNNGAENCGEDRHDVARGSCEQNRNDGTG